MATPVYRSHASGSRFAHMHTCCLRGLVNACGLGVHCQA